MKDWASYVDKDHKIYGRPLSIVGPNQTYWSVVTDRIWMILIKENKAYPRLKGDSLLTALKILRMGPVGTPTEFDKQEVGTRLDALEGLIMVEGVPVSAQRLHKLVQLVPEERALVWNASSHFEKPTLGVSCDGWQAILMGCIQLEEIPVEFPMADPRRRLFEQAMNWEG